MAPLGNFQCSSPKERENIYNPTMSLVFFSALMWQMNLKMSTKMSPLFKIWKSECITHLEFYLSYVDMIIENREEEIRSANLTSSFVSSKK